MFTPDEQKSPHRKGKKLQSIKGIFPKILQDNITEYISIYGTKDFLLKTQKGNAYSANSFSAYVKVITKKHLGIEINPHLFRDIIFTYLIKKERFDNVKAQIFLWHKPKSLSEVDMHYFDIDINDAVLSVNRELMKLYRPKKDTKIIEWKKKKAEGN